MAKIINYGQPIGAGTTVIPDNQVALDIESTDAKEYVQIDTTDSAEKLLLAGGGATVEIENASPTLTLDSTAVEDTDNGRESQILFTGLRTGGGTPAATALGKLMFSHHGTSDDNKAQFHIYQNLNADATAAAVVMNIGADGFAAFGQESNGNSRLQVNTSEGVIEIGRSNGSVISFQRSAGSAIRAEHGSGSLHFQTGGSNTRLSIFQDGKITTNNEASALCSVGGVHILGPGGTTSRTSISAGASQLVIEDNGSDGAGITIIADNDEACSIDFYTDTSANGSIRWQQSIDAFRFSTNGKEPLRLYDTKVTSYVGYQYHAGTGADNAATEPLYLADSGATLIIDPRFGNFGDVTLTENVTAVKFFYRPDDGFVYTMTAKIQQHASSAKTIDYADSAVTVYSDGGTTGVTGEMKWSGGVHHTMSTGTDDVDIVQFTIFPNGSTFNVYAAVIGQDFS